MTLGTDTLAHVDVCVHARVDRTYTHARLVIHELVLSWFVVGGCKGQTDQD